MGYRGAHSAAFLVCLGLGMGCSSWGSTFNTGDTEGMTDGMTDGTDSGESTSGSSASASASNSASASASASESESESESDSSTSTTNSSTTTTTTTTDPGSTGDDSDDSGPPPLGPGCSVQVVTDGMLFDPMSRGGAGQFPGEVADALEDMCGCHTLMNGGQNIEWPTLPAPGGTLFLDFSDMNNSFQGGTLGQAIEDQVNQLAMPPGSCPFPGDDQDILQNWFMQGRPDGANYTPL